MRHANTSLVVVIIISVSLSFGIILRQLRDNIIRSQPLDKQQQMTRLFEMLMEGKSCIIYLLASLRISQIFLFYFFAGVERNLLTKSRDR
jgi:hypothetical protein